MHKPNFKVSLNWHEKKLESVSPLSFPSLSTMVIYLNNVSFCSYHVGYLVKIQQCAN